jgi:hypothetical protein
VTTFDLTSRNKIDELPRALARGQRCGAGKCEASGSGPPSSDQKQAMSSRFPVAHCFSVCAPDGCVSVKSQLLPAADTRAMQAYQSVESEAMEAECAAVSDTTE